MAESITPTDELSVLERLQARRQALLDEVDPLIEARETERTAFETREESDDDKPSDEQRDEFNADERRFNIEQRSRLEQIQALDARIAQEELRVQRRELAENSSRSESRMSITRQPEVYNPHGDSQSPSYYVDLAAHSVPALRSKLGARADGYAERLEQHSKMIVEVMPKREQERARKAERQAEQAELEFRSTVRGARVQGFEESPFESRAPSRLTGQGGYFVPPLWLIDDYIPYLRPGRVAAGLARQMALPPGTDSINVPKLTTPTLTGVQSADSMPVATQDIKDNFVNASVKTIAGFADLPVQLIEQSPGQIIDQVITRDMLGDYDVRVDQQVISGSGVGAPLSGGQIVGLYPTTNWGATALTWTAASPTGQGFFQVLGAMASKTAQSRFNLRDFAFLTHPRRWFWAATYTDTVGRFLVQNDSFNSFNADAMLVGEQTPFEGLAGRVPFGPKVYIDANMPTTDASGGTANEDIAIGAIWDDIWLMEGEIRTDVFDQTLSGTLEIRFRLYNYIAMLQRYGPSVAIATGTGFAPPTTVDGTAY